MRRALLWVSLLTLAGCHAASNPNVGIHYPCVPGQGDQQCAAGFVCWHDGVCRDPKAAEPRLCADEAECAGWHCGPADGGLGTCYDRDVPAEIPCRANLEADGKQGDCAKGWRCGLENYCIDPSVPESRPCADDSYCAPGWRCGEVEPRRCLDTSQEALPTVAPAQLSAQSFSPQFAVLPSKGVFAVNGSSWAYKLADGGVPFRTGGGAAELKATGVVSVAMGPLAVYGLTSSELITVDRTGVANPKAHNLSPVDGPVRMRSSGKELFLFNDHEVKIAQYDGSIGTDNLVANLPSAGTPKVVDVEVLPLPAVPSLIRGDIVWVATSEGVFAAARDYLGSWTDGTNTSTTPVWQAVLLPNVKNSKCPSSIGSAQLRQMVAAPGRLVVRVVDQAGQESAIEITVNGVGQSIVPNDCSQTQTNLTIRDSIQLCPASSTLDWLKATYGDIQTQCFASDGGTLYSHISPGKVDAVPIDPIEVDRSTGDLNGWLDSSGRPWSCDSVGTCTPLTFSGGARSIFGGADGGLTVVDTGGGVNTPELGDGLWRTMSMDPSPMLATVGNSGFLAVARGTQGVTNLVVRNLTDPKPLAVLENSLDVAQLSQEDADLPVRSTLSLNRYGQQVITIAAGDRVWAGPSASLNAASPPRFGVKLVPLPFGKISSITSVDVGANSAFLQAGYLLVQERLFSYRSTTDVLWRADELTLPTDSTRPVAVWNQGSRGRLTLEDGSTFSLPSVVPISDQPAEQPVQDVLAFCGTGYLLSPSSLYRLEPVPGSAIGHWAKVDDLPQVRPVAASGRYLEGKLYVSGDSLFVVDAVGNITRLTGSCP